MKVTKLFTDGKKRCVTLSYDDGVIQDIRLVKLMNQYGLKGTFNLNTGLQGQIKFRDGIDNSRLDLKEYKSLYKGHEISLHTEYHPHLELLPYDRIVEEIRVNRKKLKKIFKLKRIPGFAYPFGTYNDVVLKTLKDENVLYGRTVLSTYAFDEPKDYLVWNPTISHRDPKLFKTLDIFVHTEQELPVFYLWGHSYEFENQNNWEIIEKFAKMVSEDNSIAFLCNLDVVEYLQAMKKVEITEQTIVNPTDKSLWFDVDGKIIEVQANSTYTF